MLQYCFSLYILMYRPKWQSFNQQGNFDEKTYTSPDCPSSNFEFNSL